MQLNFVKLVSAFLHYCMYMLNTNTAHNNTYIVIAFWLFSRSSIGWFPGNTLVECTVVYCSSLFCHSLHELILDQLIILCLLHYDMSLFLLLSLTSMVKNINLRRYTVPMATSRLVLSTFCSVSHHYCAIIYFKFLTLLFSYSLVVPLNYYEEAAVVGACWLFIEIAGRTLKVVSYVILHYMYST